MVLHSCFKFGIDEFGNDPNKNKSICLTVKIALYKMTNILNSKFKYTVKSLVNNFQHLK